MKTNDEIIKERTEEFNKLSGPRVGDFVKLPNGQYERITYMWDDKAQTIREHCGSFYFWGGGMEYSGSLDPGYEIERLKLTNEIKNGTAWIFNNNEIKAHNGYTFMMPFRVYEVQLTIIEEWQHWADMRYREGYEAVYTYASFDLWLSQNHPEIQDKSRTIWNEK